MSFTKQNISSRDFCLIEVGSYKLRLCAARIKNRKISLLGYHEKRQEVSYFSNNECLNVPGLCENLRDALHILEEQTGIIFDDIVISYPFGEIFISSKHIHYKRKDKNLPLQSHELEEIFENLEKMSLERQSQEIEKHYGFGKKQIQVILSRINSIKLDGESVKKVTGKTGEVLKISLVNGIIPKSKQVLLSQIGNVIGKKIYKIIPSEFSIGQMFPENDILILNIGATQSSLTLKKGGELLGISKIPLGMHSLIDRIAKHHHEHRFTILEKLDTPDLYPLEKAFFLEIFEASFWVALSELLENEMCPKYFYVGWGGGNNLFLRDAIQHFPFGDYGIQVPSKIEFVKEDLSVILAHMENISIDIIEKIPLEMYSLLLELRNTLAREHDTVSLSLKNAIAKLWYIVS